MAQPYCSPITSSCTAFLNENICIDALVTVTPEVTVGPIQLDCSEATINPILPSHKAKHDCTMLVTQCVRISIPLRFKADAHIDDTNIQCPLT